MTKEELFSNKNIKNKIGLLSKGTITARQNAEYFVKKIKEQNKKMNIFLSVNENIVHEAELVDKKIKSGKAGKLAGLVVAVKSCICVQGMEANCASKTLEGWIAPYNSDVVERIKAEDGLIIGMTNMDEFACGSTGEHSAFGVCVNPAAPKRVPGGSSSGSAASVSGGFCDLALGSDTGGSIRLPSSYCGVVGIKPSYGCVSRYGLIDLSMSLDQIGPIAADAYGAGLLLSVIAGKSEHDPTTFEHPVMNRIKSLKGMKIGIVSQFETVCADKRIYDHILDQVKEFAKSNGCELVDVELDQADLAVQAYYPLVYTEFYSGTRKFDGRKYGKKIETSAGEEVARRIAGGRIISQAEFKGTYYRKALAVRELIRLNFEKVFGKVDVIMSPVVPFFPPFVGEEVTDPRVEYAYDALAIPANLGGVCAVSVPGKQLDSVPFGIQIMAPHLGEGVMLTFMEKFFDF